MFGLPTGGKVKPNMADMEALGYVGFSPLRGLYVTRKYERPRRGTDVTSVSSLSLYISGVRSSRHRVKANMAAMKALSYVGFSHNSGPRRKDKGNQWHDGGCISDTKFCGFT